MSVADDLRVLRRAGVLRPIGLRTTAALTKQVLAEGLRSHLVYTLHGTRDADRPALVTSERTITWGHLLERTNRLASHFLSRGLEPGDAIALMLPNSSTFIEAQAAALRIGVSTSFINPRAPVDDATPLLDRTSAKLLVTHRDDMTPDIEVLRDGADFERAIDEAPSAEPSVGRAPEGKIVIFTSGTTGRPKGAVRSLAGGASLSSIAGFLRTIPFRTDDVHMVVCPMYHSSGSGFSLMAQILGNPLVIVERFSPEEFCRTVAEHRVTSTVVVPTMLHQVAEWGRAEEFDLSSLRVVVCTGAPLREEVRAEARDLLGDVIYDLYGSTEMGWVSVATPSDQRRKSGSVGRVVPGVDVRIVDADGRPRGPGERGEIWAGSDLLMDKYLDDPDLDSERIRDGYVSVRDVGYLDDEGYLFVVDRADDMIISGGVNVYPAETEIALGAHPMVGEASVVGMPDPKWGQRIVAAVVPASAEAPTADDLIEWCKDRVGYAAVPKDVRILESLPRNDVGKVDKRRLVADLSG